MVVVVFTHPELQRAPCYSASSMLHLHGNHGGICIPYRHTTLCMLHVCQSIILYINPNDVIMIYFQFVGELQQI